MHIPPYHRVKPDAALIAHTNFANNSGILGHIAILSELRAFTIDGFNHTI
jgi:hypothetical protein